MRRTVAGAICAAALFGVPAAAQAAPPPEGAAMSSNLEYVTRIADANGIVEGKFDRVHGDDVLVVTGRFGFKTYDVSDPKDPQLLDTYLPPELAEFGYWQNEDMELDTRRKLVIGALDPRHTEVPPTQCVGENADKIANPLCKSGFYVISYADPANLRQLGDFVALPSGHTSSCIQKCRYIWTGGPARTNNPALEWLGPIVSENPALPPSIDNRLIGDGRPIWVTDLSNPYRPEVSDQPVDIWRNDKYTDYSHDVDEDERGIAWVSGRGGIRGYATSGRHRDPYQNRWRKATPFEPILVAGGGVSWDDPGVTDDKGTARPVMFMHNSGRPTDGAVRASGVKKGNVLVGTEEEFQDCSESGRIVLSDLTDSWGGEPASQSSRTAPYRMKTLDTFHPNLDTGEGAAEDLDCSAHYFEIEGSTLGAAWYALGLRLLDISDARDVRQIAYYRVTGTSDENPDSNSWDMAFRTDRRKGDLLYLFDMSRGIEVLRMKKGAHASARMKSVTAPTARNSRYAAKLAGGLEVNRASDGGVSYVCPLFQ